MCDACASWSRKIPDSSASSPPRKLNRPWLMEEFIARLDGR